MKNKKIIFYDRHDKKISAEKLDNNYLKIDYRDKMKSLSKTIETKYIENILNNTMLSFDPDSIITEENRSFSTFDIELTDDEKNTLLNFIREEENK